mmetsp:Transcript_66271/g.181733  ORF Transcript_66271/g.181733 Transcript_66271/m.181733 type:complete len:238 (-) Transcript_66271:31-744(-)
MSVAARDPSPYSPAAAGSSSPSDAASGADLGAVLGAIVAGPASAAAAAIAACAPPFGTCAPLASGGPSVGLLPHSDASGSDTCGSSCAFSPTSRRKVSRSLSMKSRETRARSTWSKQMNASRMIESVYDAGWPFSMTPSAFAIAALPSAKTDAAAKAKADKPVATVWAVPHSSSGTKDASVDTTSSAGPTKKNSHATKKNQKRTSPPVVPGVACVIAMAARIWTRDVAASISGKGTL